MRKMNNKTKNATYKRQCHSQNHIMKQLMLIRNIYFINDLGKVLILGNICINGSL